MQTYIAEINRDPVAFLRFMSAEGYPVVHESNIFFRDIEFALVKFVESKSGKKIGYFAKAEKAAQEICAAFERTGILKRVSAQAFVVNCKDFMLARPEPAPAKPAVAASAVAEAPTA